MGKGKRIREQKAKEPITMGRGELKAYMFNVIDNLDDYQYGKFCEIFLCFCGVTDADGNLTEAYANSPYWAKNGNRLEVSELAEVAFRSK